MRVIATWAAEVRGNTEEWYVQSRGTGMGKQVAQAAIGLRRGREGETRREESSTSGGGDERRDKAVVVDSGRGRVKRERT